MSCSQLLLFPNPNKFPCRSLIPSKKEFWLSDEAVTPQHLDLYMRGEKPDVSNPVVAWASQTGKGLLFFNKKGETNRTHPSDVLALYDASDLKKSAQHEFSFKLNGDNHTFKASNDAERDGWYQSIEKSIELGKASKESVRDSETYKSEIEKLSMFVNYQMTHKLQANNFSQTLPTSLGLLVLLSLPFPRRAPRSTLPSPSVLALPTVRMRNSRRRTTPRAAPPPVACSTA